MRLDIGGLSLVWCSLSVLAAIRVFFRSRSDTALEVLALRQQAAVLKRKRRVAGRAFPCAGRSPSPGRPDLQNLRHYGPHSRASDATLDGADDGPGELLFSRPLVCIQPSFRRPVLANGT